MAFTSYGFYALCITTIFVVMHSCLEKRKTFSAYHTELFTAPLDFKKGDFYKLLDSLYILFI